MRWLRGGFFWGDLRPHWWRSRGRRAWRFFTHVPHSRDALTRAKVAKPRRGSGRRRGARRDFGWLIFPCVCGTRLRVLSCECGIYFMKSGIDRREVRSESEILVSLEFGESSG